MSSDRVTKWGLHLLALALITRCSSIPGGPGFGFVGQTFIYACFNQDADGGVAPSGDSACFDGGTLSSTTVALPSAIAVGARFSVSLGTANGVYAGRVELAAPDVILTSVDSSDRLFINGSLWTGPVITAIQPGIATVLWTQTDSYGSTSSMPGAVMGLAHVRIRRAVSLRVARVFLRDASTPIDAAMTFRLGQTEDVYVSPYDSDGNALAGVLDCTWTSTGAPLVLVKGTSLRGTLTAKYVGTTTIRVACGDLSTTFDVRVDPATDAGLDAATDAAKDADAAEAGDAPSDGDQDG